MFFGFCGAGGVCYLSGHVLAFTRHGSSCSGLGKRMEYQNGSTSLGGIVTANTWYHTVPYSAIQWYY